MLENCTVHGLGTALAQGRECGAILCSNAFRTCSEALTCEIVSGGTGVAGSGLLTRVTGAPWRSACTTTSPFLQAGNR